MGKDWKEELKQERGKGREWGPQRTLIARKSPFCGYCCGECLLLHSANLSGAPVLFQTPCQVLGLSSRASCQGDLLSHFPHSGLFYPFLSQIPALSSMKSGLLIDSDDRIQTENCAADKAERRSSQGGSLFKEHEDGGTSLCKNRRGQLSCHKHGNRFKWPLSLTGHVLSPRPSPEPCEDTASPP